MGICVGARHLHFFLTLNGYHVKASISSLIHLDSFGVCQLNTHLNQQINGGQVLSEESCQPFAP